MINSKKRLLTVCLAVLLLIGSLVIPSSVGYASYNDEKYDSYQNMNGEGASADHVRYVVPNLYRQDASYSHVKTFPLVVSGGVEYFPLDIFALYSYLEVVYAKLSYGFYINNTKNNHYVAFDLNSGTTTTHDNDDLGIKAELFYRTYYVPAKVVCETLGLTFESYDDPENGIHAARISDSRAKSTLEELVKLYSPTPKPPQQDPVPEKDDPPSLDPPVSNDPIPPVTAPVDPYKTMAARNLYLTFENLPTAGTDAILDRLKSENVKGMFFVEKEKILAYPDTVRRILADGHRVGIYLSPLTADGTVLSPEQLVEALDSTKDALQLVTKKGARFVRLAPGYADFFSKNGTAGVLAEHGYVFYDYSMTVADASGVAQTAFDSIKTVCFDKNMSTPRTVYLRFGSYNATAGTLEHLFSFADKYSQVHFLPSDEFCTPPVFVR